MVSPKCCVVQYGLQHSLTCDKWKGFVVLTEFWSPRRFSSDITPRSGLSVAVDSLVRCRIAMMSTLLRDVTNIPQWHKCHFPYEVDPSDRYCAPERGLATIHTLRWRCLGIVQRGRLKSRMKKRRGWGWRMCGLSFPSDDASYAKLSFSKHTE